MRSGLVGLASAMALAATMAIASCNRTSGGGGTGGIGTGGSSSSGGTTGTGGSTGSSGQAGGSTGSGGSSCSNVTANVVPCGGDVVGTWTVTPSCLQVTGELDLSYFGAGCSSAPVTGSLQVTGTWTANSNGTYTDNTTTSGDEQFALAASCLVISSTPVTCDGAASLLINIGYSSLTCPSAAGGGCSCPATVHQTGGLGVVSPAPSTSGRYTTSGNVVTIDEEAKYSYCVSGNTMTMTPQSEKPTMTGTIVLQKSGSSGSGGTTGSGGQAGSGGTRGSGGATGSGGAGGTGGFGGSGGKSGTGGAVGAGGTTGTGGQAGSGGTRGSGGATGSGGSRGSGGATGSGGTSTTSSTGGTTGTTRPCDIYAAASTPCVAAHSSVRALYGTYNGKLYQVRRVDNTTKDILTLAAGGIADTAPQDTFCSGSTCVITVLYDQSGKGNDMWYQGSEQVPASTSSSAAKVSESLNVGGHKVYSLYINAGNCYWHDGSKSGMATGAQPEGMYMVTSGKHFNSGCCFDYGNSETSRSADGSGTMDAINFSSITAWGTGAGSGPWVMADLEWGVFSQGSSGKNPNDPSHTEPYVTGVLKNNGTTEFALRGGDATSGSLSTYYKGGLPGGWSPMKKQGAITLGCGGDCCKPGGGANLSAGTFYEGAIVSGYPTDATEDAVQANIVAAGYGT